MNKNIVLVLLLFLLAVIFFSGKIYKNQNNMKVENDKKMVENVEWKKAYFSGGCFWCIEAPLQEKRGIKEVISGYIGGDASTANYEDVSTGRTKHRESVEVIYNPQVVDYRMLVKTFLYQIDPTDEGGQFADRGYQYTTAIHYQNEEEKKIALEEIEKIKEAKKFQKEIALKVIPFKEFFRAEEYHQDFYKKSSEHYERYKKASGRKDFIEEN